MLYIHILKQDSETTSQSILRLINVKVHTDTNSSHYCMNMYLVLVIKFNILGSSTSTSTYMIHDERQVIKKQRIIMNYDNVETI